MHSGMYSFYSIDSFSLLRKKILFKINKNDLYEVYIIHTIQHIISTKKKI